MKGLYQKKCFKMFLIISVSCSLLSTACDGSSGADVQSAGISIEAEDFTSTHDCEIASSFSGYTGTGFVNYGRNGAWIEFSNIDVPADGDYQLTFRYAAVTSDRPCSLFINGKYKTQVDFSTTGGWSILNTESVIVYIKTGANTIRLVAGINGGPNLDNISILGL